MSQTIPEIPETLRLEAITAGLDATEADSLWQNYCRWSLSKWPDKGLGGTSWTRQIENQIKRRASENERRIFVAQDRAQKAELAEAEYKRDAVTFGQWVVGIQARAQRGENMPVWEQMLVKWAETADAGGLQQFMTWYAAKMELVNANRKAKSMYVSPEEQRRSDLGELEYFDEGGVT
jgi:hypothetical protein